MERLKEKTDHFGLVGGKFNEQEHLLTRIVLGSYKMSRFLRPPKKTCLYCGLNRVQSHIQPRCPYHHIGISSLCPQAACSMGKDSAMHIANGMVW